MVDKIEGSPVRVERMAIVSDADWVRTAFTLLSRVGRVRVAAWRADDEQHARAWIAAG